jgi:hypothetical protein
MLYHIRSFVSVPTDVKYTRVVRMLLSVYVRLHLPVSVKSYKHGEGTTLLKFYLAVTYIHIFTTCTKDLPFELV